MSPELSVLLVSWNTRGETGRCLRALHDAATGLAYEVIAVDNASVDGSADLLAGDPRVHLITNRHNVGFAAAMNQARRQAGGDLLLLLNSDVQLHPGSLSTMVRFLREHPDAAGVSPRYLNPDGTFQQHYVQLPSLAACLALFTAFKKVPWFRDALHRFEMRGEDFSVPRELASGSCLLLRAEVVGADAIFDERFPVYWNDAILARELAAAGHRTWMIPDAAVTHTRGASCRLLGPAMRYRHLLGSLMRYLEVTRPRYQCQLFRVVLVLDQLLKSVLGRTTTLGWSDLLAALRADTGPLPDGDTRDWEIVVDGRPAVGGTAAGSDTRRLLVDTTGVPRWPRLTVQQVDGSQWRASMSTALPGGPSVPAVAWINERIAAAQLRRWLDGHAGARTLQLGDRHRALARRLGHDVVVHRAG